MCKNKRHWPRGRRVYHGIEIGSSSHRVQAPFVLPAARQAPFVRAHRDRDKVHVCEKKK